LTSDIESFGDLDVAFAGGGLQDDLGPLRQEASDFEPNAKENAQLAIPERGRSRHRYRSKPEARGIESGRNHHCRTAGSSVLLKNFWRTTLAAWSVCPDPA
jgi:hypothetical protein